MIAPGLEASMGSWRDMRGFFRVLFDSDNTTKRTFSIITHCQRTILLYTWGGHLSKKFTDEAPLNLSNFAAPPLGTLHGPKNPFPPALIKFDFFRLSFRVKIFTLIFYSTKLPPINEGFFVSGRDALFS